MGYGFHEDGLQAGAAPPNNCATWAGLPQLRPCSPAPGSAAPAPTATAQPAGERWREPASQCPIGFGQGTMPAMPARAPLHLRQLLCCCRCAQGQPPAPQPQYGAVLQPNQRALLSFFERDHGFRGTMPRRAGGCPGCSRCWPSTALPMWMATSGCKPTRAWGYTFKPVSFWYCFRAGPPGGALRAVVAEVNNTFGERHCYVLDAPAWGQNVVADKAFHVSPFCASKATTCSVSPARSVTACPA